MRCHCSCVVSSLEPFKNVTDTSSFPAVELVAGKAHDIERYVWTNMGGTNADYKSKVRSLFVNLKDKSNPGLRASIVDGSLSPEKFSKMTSQVRVNLVYSILITNCEVCYRKWLQRKGRRRIRRFRRRTSSNHFQLLRSKQRRMRSSVPGASRCVNCASEFSSVQPDCGRSENVYTASNRRAAPTNL